MSREPRQMPGTLNRLTKRGKRPPGAIVITHNHVSAAQLCTHTDTHTRHVHLLPQSRLTHTQYRLCQEGPLGPVRASG